MNTTTENDSGLLTAVVTTIQRPTVALHILADRLNSIGGSMLVVGDRKGPDIFELAGARFFDLNWQIQSSFGLARQLPIGHYARKNIGYLEAIRTGASCLYETDDDNAPNHHWAPRSLDTPARCLAFTSQWVNVYRCFTSRLIWPRGLPLDEIVKHTNTALAVPTEEQTVRAPIQQGLADNSPDVDAVWRLVLDAPFVFDGGPSIHLPPGAWCPFNSQSTWWWPQAYPLLYLPSHCSFRMTDIWRSFIAQRCLWELGHGLVFHAPEVVQDRNPHDLMRDFNDEVPGYQRNRELVQVLEGLVLAAGQGQVGANLRTCYAALVARNFFPQEELSLVDAWLSDLERLV
jgi:hypothetical protein